MEDEFICIRRPYQVQALAEAGAKGGEDEECQHVSFESFLSWPSLTLDTIARPPTPDLFAHPPPTLPKSYEHLRPAATTSCEQRATNTARRVLCPAVGLVWTHARLPQLQDADSIAEDPSEFFTILL
jgi:hypothetical protein